MIRVLLRDFTGLLRVCGFRIAFKWLACVIKTFPQCRASHTLMPADRAMGSGPFKVGGALIGWSDDPGQSASVVFSGIREIWVRNIYLGGVLSIPEDGTVVDLGANRGIFTALALAKSKGVKVLAVEPSRLLNESFGTMIKVNDWQGRVSMIRAFIGGLAPVQERALSEDSNYTGVPFVDPDYLVRDIRKIDFLKCDIEGSEFGLLETSLFAKAARVAAEVHDIAGDREQFIAKLKNSGFNVLSISHSAQSCIVLASRQ